MKDGSVLMSQIISVTSGKGGAGKSSVSVGLATSFARSGNKVIVVEFDIGLRCVDIMLGVENEVVYDLGDIIAGRCAVGDAIIQAEDRGQLDYIAAPNSIDTEFDFDKVLHCIRVLRRMQYDYIIIDAPAGLGLSILSVKNLADLALIVTTPDPICMRDGAKVASLIEQAGFSNYRLIINRVSRASLKKSGVRDLDDVIDAVGAQLIGVIPENMEYQWALAQGRRLSDKQILPSIFDAIARRIQGVYVPLILETI